jgi:uncharacterized protein (TIGR02117 family)
VAPLKQLLRDLAHPIFLVIFLIHACSKPTVEMRFREEGKNVKSVFIVHDSWHSAIVIKKTDISAAILPELRDFSDAEYLEFSWGDRDYFPAPDPGLALALKAAFWSSGSVLHVVGLNGAMEKLFPNAEIIEVGLSEEAFQRLVKFVSDTFSRSHPAVPAEARPGLSSNARFYSAEGKFSILRTCNTWVAEALSSAGLPISPGSVITASSLGNQVRPFGARK